MKKTGFSNPWDARNHKKNIKLRIEQYEWQKEFIRRDLVDYKDSFVYNLMYDIKSENVNE